MRAAIAFSIGALALAAGDPAAACGGAAPCALVGPDGAELGAYLAYPPAAPAVGAGGAPALVFMHGWQATAADMARDRALLDVAERLGAVLVLPEGEGKTWSYPGSPASFRDEFAYFAALRAELIARHGVDPDRIVISGFSMGASMVWSLACHTGDDYAAALPFAGAFWTPLPSRCPRPVQALLHTHGEADDVVPMTGRPIGARFAQGDVAASFAALTAELEIAAPETATDARGYACETRHGTGRSLGRVYELCTHAGGHMFDAGWIEAAWPRLFPAPDAAAAAAPAQ